MLWDIVFQFYVSYIFGGAYRVNGQLKISTGIFGVSYLNGSWGENANTAYFNLELNGQYISIGNYLSLIATIITMVVILLLCCALIKKIYNICAHIIG